MREWFLGNVNELLLNCKRVYHLFTCDTTNNDRKNFRYGPREIPICKIDSDLFSTGLLKSIVSLTEFNFKASWFLFSIQQILSNRTGEIRVENYISYVYSFFMENYIYLGTMALKLRPCRLKSSSVKHAVYK